MGWNNLNSVSALEQISTASTEKPQLVFKHSTRCSISSAAKHRLEADLDKLGAEFDLHFLDLILHRDVSNEIASRFGIMHQSPQVIVLRNGQPVFDMSHYDILPADILSQLKSTEKG